MYVPSYYIPDRPWPLVVTLHGTYVWESYSKQIKEWKQLAEAHGFIVAAPKMRSASVQGILPVMHSSRMKALREDDKMILSLLKTLSADYTIDSKAVMLTGFSGGGLPVYYTGLSHPDKFNLLVARSSNSDIKQFEEIAFTKEAKQLPIYIYWGKDDFSRICDQSWQAYRFLKERGFTVEKKEKSGGHIRRPEIAYEYWKTILPNKYHR